MGGSFEVRLPENVVPGAKIKVHTPDGRTVVATVPDDAVPGQQFRVGMPAGDVTPPQSSSAAPNGAASRTHAHRFGKSGGLLDLAVQGDAAGIAARLADGANPNQIEDGWFPLAGAALRCDCDCLESLLNGKADPNQAFPQTGRTAAMICALMDIELGAAVQLAGGADEEDVIQAVDVSTAASFHRSSRRIVRKSACRALHLLHKHGADLSMRDAAGDSVATMAAASADSQALALLCALGGDVTRPNARRETALLLAAKRRSVGGVAVLLGTERTLQPERLEKANSMCETTGIDLADYIRGSQDANLAEAPMRTLVELLCMAIQREHLPLCFLVLREATFQRGGRRKSVLELLRLEDCYGLTALHHASYLMDPQSRKQFTTLLTRVGADVCAELRVSRMDIPPVKKERGTSLAGEILSSAHLSANEAQSPGSSELLLQRLREQAEHRPEDWTIRALRATFGQIQDRTALHFAALRSTTDKGGVWARVLLEHQSPIVPDLFGNTAVHIAAERFNVGALTAILNAISKTENQTWGYLSLDDIVNMEDHMQRSPLDLLHESRNMLESTLSDSYCACCASKSRRRRWTIFRRADVSEALDEMFATCGGFAGSSAKNVRADGDDKAIHSFTDDHCISKWQFEVYLRKVGAEGELADDVWRDLASAPADSHDATRGQNKMNRVQFGRAVYAVGREASIFHDYIKLCALAGQNTMRVIDLLATVRTEGNTVKQRVDALLEDGQLCEKLLLQHGAQPQSQRNRQRLFRRITLCVCSPLAFVYGSAIMATKPFFSTCQSLGELSAFPCHDKGHRGQQAAAVAFLVVITLGCWVIPVVTATVESAEARATMAVFFRMFFITVVLLTQFLGLHRVLSENVGFFPDPSAPEGGPNPHLKGSKDGTAFADVSLHTSVHDAESTRMSTEALMAFKVPSERYTKLHGWWQHGEEGVKQTKAVKVVKVKTMVEASAEAGRAKIHLDDSHINVQPRHTYLPVSARLWPFVPLCHNAKFVLFQIVEVIQLASLPVKPPDPGKEEHKWVPEWFSTVGDFLRGFMVEFPEMENMHTEFFFGAVAFCGLWALVCGYMMLGLVSRQHPELQQWLPAFSPDFLFRITWLVEFFVLGPCNMIVIKWLMRAADCTYVAEEEILYYDLDRSVRCFEGVHTARASLGATLLILYTLTTANFGPSFIETWSDQKDIRARPTFVAMTSCVKLISVCVVVLLTRIQWAMVLFPVLSSLWLLYISLRQPPPTNIAWADQLVAATYTALLLHSVCVALAWMLQDFTTEATRCSTTTSGVVDESIECVEEDESPMAEMLRVLPTLLHQIGLILLFTCCLASRAFCRQTTKVEVVQTTSSLIQERKSSAGIQEAGGDGTTLRPQQPKVAAGDGEDTGTDATMMPAFNMSGEGSGNARETIVLHRDTSTIPEVLLSEAGSDWLLEAEQAVHTNA